MTKKNLPTFEDIEVFGVSSDGRAIARINDVVTFVPWAVPGDRVDVQIVKRKSTFMEGYITQIRERSNMRVVPKCEHFGICGGCKWQMLAYHQQLVYKEQQVKDAMQRIGKIQTLNIQPIIGAKHPFYYRNKLEFAFAYRQWLTSEQMQTNQPFTPGLGFHISGCFDKVLDIHQCHLMSSLHNDIRNTIRQYALNNNLTFYNEHEHKGLLRNLILRNNNNNEWMVVIVFGENTEQLQTEPGQKEKRLLHFVQQSFPQISSLMYCYNTKMNDSISDLPVMKWSGNDHIIETLEDLHFKVGPKTFYQTNNEQVLELYNVVRSFITSDENKTPLPIVYDLYTGTGTIALFIARHAQKVIGIEYIKEAVDDAILNAEENKISNVHFVVGDMKDVLRMDFIERNGLPDVIITDPPRAGMHPDVIQTIIRMRCPKIIYVSCNPPTQARDINLLQDCYDVVAMQPVDMFPHTQHVENVALLQLKHPKT